MFDLGSKINVVLGERSELLNNCFPFVLGSGLMKSFTGLSSVCLFSDA